MPLDQGRFPLEWEEWPRGEDTVVKLPDDPSARFFRLGIVEERRGAAGERGAGKKGGQRSSVTVRGQGGDKGRGKRGERSSGRGEEVRVEGLRTSDDEGLLRKLLTSLLPLVQRKFPIVRCTADAEFVVDFAGSPAVQARMEQLPVLFLLTVALNWAAPVLGITDLKFLHRLRDGKEDDGRVWEEVQMWCLAVELAWQGGMKLEAEDDYGPSDGASGSSSRSDSSGRNRRNQGRIEDDGTGKEGEEAAYLKAWPGGVNLVACLREMLLGEPCYCPVSPAAPSTSAAPTTPAAPSTPASLSTPAAPPISVVPNHAKPAPALGTEYTGTAVGGERKVASGGELNAIEAARLSQSLLQSQALPAAVIPFPLVPRPLTNLLQL
ncbi:unnamed protein product [Closterium sp. NIES-64]|nr:unnamed protein product [Closterium sp. NIES-64]